MSHFVRNFRFETCVVVHIVEFHVMHITDCTRKQVYHRALFHVGPGYPLSPLSLHFSVFCSFLLFLFLGGFNYFLLLSIPFLSTRIVPLRFQAGGRRKRPNLGLVCSFYFVLSVFHS